PIVDKVCYSGDTCVVFLTQLLCPRLFPLVELRLPVIVTLSFRETDIDSGLVKIFRHHESWTIDDMIHSVPLISYWYDHIVRFMMGKLLVSAGHVIHVTTETIDLLSTRSREIEEARIQLALLNASKAATQRK
ncbi:uncharacterized protein BYT42DRAFT_491190, partial [Radiomyces spectabilis]|uniref:uncharacterized protein n=1 Tax=Radiomyces spectabilis TaxID=64574 RepID=UPI00222045AE